MSLTEEDTERARDFWAKTNPLKVVADDPVESPKHYTSHPSGAECIEIVEHMNFNLGNVIKYVWRSGEKGDAVTDLKKARWYLEREIARIGGKT
jgi:hypothetical protein